MDFYGGERYPLIRAGGSQMKLDVRHYALALAAVLAVAFALSHRHAAPPAIPTPVAIPDAPAPPPPPPPPDVAVKPKPKRRAHIIPTASAEEPVQPASVRGSRLREKGEALGGHPQ